MFNVSALLLDDALKPATSLANGALNQELWQFVPLSDDRLLQLVSWIVDVDRPFIKGPPQTA